MNEWGNHLPILEGGSYVLTGLLLTFCAWNVYQSEDYVVVIHVIVAIHEIFVTFREINAVQMFYQFCPISTRLHPEYYLKE